MKKWVGLIVTLICLCFIMLSGCFFNEGADRKETVNMLEIAIFPSSMYDESYYFLLTQDGVLHCAVGTRNDDNLNQNDFLKFVKESLEIALDESDIQILILMYFLKI
jgi:hypothetical protein